MVPRIDLTAFRFFRQAANMSQEKLADLAGISQVKVSKIETGKAIPALATFCIVWGASYVLLL